jgi:hypothetical protein
MDILDNFIPIVLDESANQERELTRLKNWVKRASEVEPEDALFPGIAKLIEFDLLRYGSLHGDFGLRCGFGVVCESAAARAYIEREVLPMNLNMGCVLMLLANGNILMETAGTNCQPEFVFWAVAKNRDH